MSEDTKSIASEQLVTCDVCLKEVPKSEAIIPEASDYVAHFCGLECHEKWKNQNEKSNVSTKDSSSS